MILFPLGSPIFADLGSSGISIFYVSVSRPQLFKQLYLVLFKHCSMTNMLHRRLYHKSHFQVDLFSRVPSAVNW
jgi:hypothetical protein